MANHKSAQKRIRSSAKRNVRNKLAHKTTRNAIRDLRATESAKDGAEGLKSVSSLLDKLVKKNIIHKNKAGNIKSGLAKHVASLK
jgi:small subunit ribosomal protein S20